MVKLITKNANLTTWKAIVPYISGYLIKHSYLKLNKMDRFSEFKSNININTEYPKDWNEDDYFELREIGTGSIFIVHLIYEIERGELFALKKPHIFSEETDKLYKREVDNYKNIKHPLIPKFYGTIKSKRYLFIEFINGLPLNIVKEIESKDKILIINAIILILLYFHTNDYILRDLKPNNIIIDQNKTAVIIDFDRMVKKSEISNDNYEFTSDFGSYYTDNEVNKGNISEKNDIYSLYNIIFDVINKKEPGESRNDYFDKYPLIRTIYNKCLDKNTDIKLLAADFYLYYFFQIEKLIHSQIIINAFYYFKKNKSVIEEIFDYLNSFSDPKNFAEMYYIIGQMHKYYLKNMNSAITYYMKSAELSHPKILIKHFFS